MDDKEQNIEFSLDSPLAFMVFLYMLMEKDKKEQEEAK